MSLQVVRSSSYFIFASDRERLELLELLAHPDLRVQEESLVPMALLAPLVPLWVDFSADTYFSHKPLVAYPREDIEKESELSKSVQSIRSIS